MVSYDLCRWRPLGWGATFRIDGDRLLVCDHAVNGDSEVVDKVKTLVGGTATIFMRDTRVSTNVMKADGSRAVGTQLAKGPAYESVFVRKQPLFRGEVEILGQPYMTAYDPLLDPAVSTWPSPSFARATRSAPSNASASPRPNARRRRRATAARSPARR
ncbi:cache domain-containing protein [Magnetospirillum sp. UT-4]|uniref:cache domain-containing protein n=1 Tax=Magnetospirillum sp. UT-4 TaxID=2681467 RepID=UPI0013836E3F|nr:cache domain-containing protein [Magnetospirillum sp. UT-4]CAA7613209.1 hypothetical protein MTBUT4_130019 [Magnetospirillum sp. UT-4]